jgi:Cysteine-rich CPCC
MNLSQPTKHPCPCCQHLTIDDPGRFDICPICGWEDDPIQRDDPNYQGGANEVSLSEARANYRNCGVSNPKVQQLVAQPAEILGGKLMDSTE